MPTWEVVTTEVLVTKIHIESETEEEAVGNLENGSVIRQYVTDADIESVSIVSE